MLTGGHAWQTLSDIFLKRKGGTYAVKLNSYSTAFYFCIHRYPGRTELGYKKTENESDDFSPRPGAELVGTRRNIIGDFNDPIVQKVF
jgi:hypothetical protein